MPNVTVYGRSLALLLLLACAKKAPEDAPGETNEPVPGTCTVDTAKDVASAIAWTAAVQGQICPRADVDYYSFTQPAGNDLVDVTASYASQITRVDLSVQITDSAGNPVPGGGASDTVTNDTASVLKATFKLAPGNYVAAVRDLGDDERDDQNSYTFDLAFAKDPDTHEPNDDVANAKAADTQPGWFSYANDKDVFAITTTAGTPIVSLHIASNGGVHYSLQDSSGNEVAVGDEPAGTNDYTANRVVPAAGTYYLVLTQPAGQAPDHSTGASYSLSVMVIADPDAHEAPTRNDTPATPTCAYGTAPNCDSGFSGADTTAYSTTGRLATLGDRDFFAFTVSSNVPAIAEITLDMGASIVSPAMTVFYPDPATACTTDDQCQQLTASCGDDFDCEASHACLPNGHCAGGNLCLPGGHCAVPHVAYQPVMSSQDTAFDGIDTSVPLFVAGTYYILVHDFQETSYDAGTDYSLRVRVRPEPDPADQAPAASGRNNFYNPYPIEAPQRSATRAIDITDRLRTAGGVTGFISYQSDEDWFKFRYPCGATGSPATTCGLVFEYTQPATTHNMRPLFYVRQENLSVHLSFFDTAVLPNGGASTDKEFGSSGQCGECSFADARHVGPTGTVNDGNYYYYLQVRDYGSNDFEVEHPYRIRLQAPTPGCPTECSNAPQYGCTCSCDANGNCPSQSEQGYF